MKNKTSLFLLISGIFISTAFIVTGCDKLINGDKIPTFQGEKNTKVAPTPTPTTLAKDVSNSDATEPLEEEVVEKPINSVKVERKVIKKISTPEPTLTPEIKREIKEKPIIKVTPIPTPTSTPKARPTVTPTLKATPINTPVPEVLKPKLPKPTEENTQIEKPIITVKKSADKLQVTKHYNFSNMEEFEVKYKLKDDETLVQITPKNLTTKTKIKNFKVIYGIDPSKLDKDNQSLPIQQIKDLQNGSIEIKLPKGTHPALRFNNEVLNIPKV
jgi:hypothetical protein